MPQRTIHYADEDLDRAAERREDDAWLSARLTDAATRMVVIAGRKHPVHRKGMPTPVYLAPDDVPGSSVDEPPILLGVRGDVAYFAVEVDDDSLDDIASDEIELVGLRDVVARLGHADAAALALGGALVHWHATHRFCPACGHPSTAERAGHMRLCANPECGRQHFPRMDPAVITLVIDGERCLLARRNIWPVNRRSTIAGFVEHGETLEHAVRREILEEVGVRIGEVCYRGSQPWPFPASLMLGFWAIAESVEITVDGDEIAEADWYTRERIAADTEAGKLLLPPVDSISRRLVSDWIESGATPA